MVAMARRIVASEVMVRCVITPNAPTGRERLSRAMAALDSLPASGRTTRSSGQQQTVTIENGDAFAEQRRNGFGHSPDIAGTGQSLT